MMVFRESDTIAERVYINVIPAGRLLPGSRFRLYCFLFLVIVSDVQTVDPRDPSCPFLRSRWRVLQLLFGPLLGSGYYHLLSDLWLPFALGR